MSNDVSTVIQNTIFLMCVCAFERYKMKKGYKVHMNEDKKAKKRKKDVVPLRYKVTQKNFLNDKINKFDELRNKIIRKIEREKENFFYRS